MKTTLIKILVVLLAILATSSFSVFGLIDDDADGDGVPDSTDACPAENSSLFDRDGDGCLDDARGARHIEYWSTTDAVITYVINDLGAPGISDDSEITAVQAAIDSWTNIADTGLNVEYGGTTAQQDGNGLDGINLVTFRDDTYNFGGSTIAVGLTTSFETDTVVEGRLYRAGEIFDADMLFNPNMIFRTGPGAGTDVQSVAAHEAGHLFGISHTAIRSSTMSYVLPKGTAARSLEADDELAYFKAYGSEAALAAANRIEGTVHNGQTNEPIPGAIVFITNAAGGDSVGCDFTLPDGSFSFPGLADGNYHVQIFPLNGSSLISFMEPANVNSLVLSTAVTVFVPEFFDANESESDDAADKVSINLNGGDTEVANLLTNIDTTAPEVVSMAPDGSNNIRIDAPFRLKFSEAVDVSTIAASFSMKKAGNIGIGGNITVIRDDSVLVFQPRPALEFSTSYTLTIDTDLEDLQGNPLESTFTLNVTTLPEPPVSINSLVPSKGVAGTVVVINGNGFVNSPFTTVTLSGLFTNIVSIEPGRIVITIPAGTSTGPVVVTNPDLTVSNPLTFTVLTQAEVARGYESGDVPLSGTPHAVAVTPSGGYAYVASTAGADAIVVDPALQGYLTSEPIPYAAGLVDIASSADGRRMYAVSAQSDEFVEIDSDPADGLVFNEILATRDVLAGPLGIVTEPAADRAFIATDKAEIQIWDVHLGSETYRQQIGVMSSPGGLTLRGEMAITPAGDRLLGLTDSGEVLFYDLTEDSLVDQVSIGPDPRDIVVDPAGERAYVTHANGDISVVSTGSNPFFVQSIATSGTLRGAAISPGAFYLYATDRDLDRTKIIDLDQTHATFRSVVEAIPLATNPVDVTLSPDGFYAFTVLQGESEPRLVVTTVGVGPVIRSVYPTAGQPGTLVMITGSFPAAGATIDFNGIVVNPSFTQTVEEVIATVPAGFVSGPIRVLMPPPPGGTQATSNAVFFEALVPPDGFKMRFAAELEVDGGVCADVMTEALAIRPQGDVLFAGCGGGVVRPYDIQPGSTRYHQLVDAPMALFSSSVADIVITADGQVGFASAVGAPKLKAFIANPNDPNFGLTGNMDVSLEPPVSRPYRMATSPNNRDMIVWEDSSNVLYLFDTTIMYGQLTLVIVTALSLVAVDTLTTAFAVTDVTFHPTGKAAYFTGFTIGTIDLDFESEQYRTIIFDELLENLSIAYAMGINNPWSYSIEPSLDGSTLFIYMVDRTTPFSRNIFKLNTTNPRVTSITGNECLGAGTASQWAVRPLLRISPRGIIGIQTNEEVGFIFYDPNCPSEAFFEAVGLNENTQPLDYEFTPDGQRFYVASTFHDRVRMYDFSAAHTLLLASGNNQSGVTSTTLPAPLRVQVVGSNFPGDPTFPVAGIPVTFEAESGNGTFVATTGFLNPIVVSTDASGFAEVQWQTGTTVGAQMVTVSAAGLTGSPSNFSATLTADPSTLPLTLAEVLPLNSATNTSITTATLITFSRAVEVTSISSTSLFIESAADATKVPVAYGFSDSGRRVSMIPTTPLATSHLYNIVYDAAIVATNGGGALTNPGESSFTTQLPPPLVLSAINPPSSLRGVAITLSGTGFDPVPANNTVYFNDVPATPVSGDVNDLTVHVPLTALAGEVTVVRGVNTSNAMPFTVLVPNTSPIDDVLSNVGTGSGTKSCAVTGDGALAYTVSTDGDVVIPIDITGLTAMDPIPVGDQPVALVIHPNSDFLYVANFNSGTVSVIGTNPDVTATFNQVITTIQVGVNPVDLAIGPSGDLLYVVNAASLPTENVSIVDVDGTHVDTFNQVLSNVGTGSGAKSVAVSGDGTRLFVGTDTGFVIIGTDVADPAGYHQVLSNVNTGSGSKSMAVSPDGTLLFIVTTSGSILVVDVSPGGSNAVLSNVGTGSGAKSVAVSGDGTLLYIVQENSSDVLVVAINVIPGVGVQNAPDGASTFQVETSVVHTVKVGEDPSDVAIDPSGTGVVIVTNTGDKTVSILNGSSVPLGDVPAEIIVSPSTLKLSSKGNYVTASIELPGFFVEEIVVSSVRLQQVIPPVPGSEEILDADNDGIMELVLDFSRAEFQAILPQGEFVTVTVTGTVRTRTFAGEDVIRTLRPNVVHPHGGINVLPGATTSIQWTTPNGYSQKITAVDIHFSGDNGVSWTQLANQIPNSGAFNWTAPVNVYMPQCRVLITMWEDDEMFAQGMNQDVFSVSSPVAVRLKSFEVAVEDGDAVLRWETNFEDNMDGFQVVRADAEAGVYTSVTKDLVPAKGDETGAGYEYRDAGIRPNRTYWYKLVEVTPDGEGSQFGPYSVTFKLTNSLEQNMPNPFNPSTSIKYAIAHDENVSLVIYDVAGRQVRTLVDDRQRADVYKVTWDGINNNGQRVASGMYFYKLAAGKFVQTKKMMLLK